MKWRRKRSPNSKIVGLAVEEDFLTAVVIKKCNGGVTIEDLVALRVSQGNCNSIFKNWVKENNLEGAVCYLVVSPEKVATYQVNRPPVEADELEDALRWKIKEFIDFDVQDAVIDTFDYPEDALRGRHSIVNVVVSRKAYISELVELVSGSGLNLKAIDIPELAFRNIASLYTEAGRSIAMLCLDQSVGTISLFKNDQLYFSRQVNIDASVFGDSDDKEKVEEGVGQLCLEIQRSFDYFESQLNQATPKRLLLYATTRSTRLQGSISSRLNIEATVLDLRRLGIEVGSTEFDIEERVTSLRAVGAALRQELV